MLRSFKSLVQGRIAREKKRYARGSFKTLTMCKQCYTFRYKNSWHFEKPELLESEGEATLPVRFVQCPACIEQENAIYESESGLVWGRG